MGNSKEAKIYMINIIKTAIVTIVISIISGLLVEYFKNLAPRILCSIGNGMPVKNGNRKVYVYSITVSNLSKKIIHELSLNVQSSGSNIKVADAKITKGLKFESSLKDNILDIDIPFLSKGDEFSIKLYSESRKKPVIVMRSPENFKQIDSIEQNGFLASVFTNKDDGRSIRKSEKIVPNEKDDYTMVMNKPLRAEKTINKGILSDSKNKKILIATASVILLVFAAVLVKFYFIGASTKLQAPTAKADTGKQSNDKAQTSNKENKNPSVKVPENRKTENTGSGGSQGGTNQNSSSNVSQSGVKQDPKAAANETNANSNTSQGKANESEKPQEDAANKSKDTNATTNETSGTQNTSSSNASTAGNNSTSTQTNGAGNTGK